MKMISLLNKQENSNYMAIKIKEIKEETISNEKTKKTEDGTVSYSNKKIINLNEVQKQIKNIQIFENFELKNYIDSGSESNVYKIQHKKTKKDYVLKIINHHKNKDRRNLNELKITSKLKHQKVIDFNGYFISKKEDDNNEYIIMENAKYGNLRNFLLNTLKIKRCLSESMICYLSYQILEGLNYCHRCKVAHMDIKPQNIVVDDYLNAKLIDFSISINYKNKEPNEKIKIPFKGTPFYMSYEVYNSDIIEYKNINKIDIYALGVFLFNIAFGCYPYNLNKEDEKDITKIKEKLKGKLEIKNRNNYSSYFIDFISKLLESDINKRMSIYEAIQHPWIKGAKFLYDEKEKMYNLSSFVTKLLTDSIYKFNDFLKKF